MVLVPTTFLKKSSSEHELIPVSRDLSSVICHLTELDEVIVQAHQPSSSLATRMHRDHLAQSIETTSVPNNFQLDLNSLDIAAAHANVANCECCGSPGYINFFNTKGERFLKFGVPANVSLDFWSNIVSSLPRAQIRHSSAYKSTPSTQTISAPSSATLIPLTKSGFFKLITDFGQIGQPLQYTLPQPGMTVRNYFAIEQIDDNDNRITCRGSDSGFEINLRKVSHFALSSTEPNSSLLLLDDSMRVLLELALIKPRFPSISWEASIQYAIDLF